MLHTVRPEYVESFPKTLDDGVLYISKRFRTSCHQCCCGCGTKIVTPIRPTEYRLTERDGLISLHPSIGNWNHPCQSHYVIRDNKVLWAEKMLPSDIKRGRVRDDAEKDAYFGATEEGWWWKVIRWIGRLFR
jgi:Family of unknown function (DUF6527)